MKGPHARGHTNTAAPPRPPARPRNLGRLAAAALAAATLVHAAPARAELALPAVFGDGMVLQRGEPAPVWGRAEGGARVVVRVAGEKAVAEAAANGRFRVDLPALEAGGPHVLRVSAGDAALRFEDVLVGDVFLVSGQSNAAFALRGSEQAAWAKKRVAKLDRLRLRKRDAWKAATPETAAELSAVGIYFALELARDVDAPIGLVQRAVGGTAIRSYVSRAALAREPAVRREILEAWRKYRATYDERLAAWKRTPEDERRLDEPPRLDGRNAPGHLFRNMIRPLAPYALRGVLWYQGESDAWGFPVASLYEPQLRLLIADWRRRFDDPDLPFILFQLPHYEPKAVTEPKPMAPWSLVQEAQARVAETTSGVALNVGIDTEAETIHPKNKRFFGERAGRVALGAIYGRDVPHRGPTLERMRIEGETVTLDLDHAEGLRAAGGDLVGFAVAGPDRAFHWADARIAGESVILTSPAEENPVAVRYAFWDWAPWSLENAHGLPAGPFRTDDWSWDMPVKRHRRADAAPASSAPVIDGALDDGAWRGAEASGAFERVHTYAPAPHPTKVRALWDERALYVAFRCAGQAEPRAEAGKRDAKGIWRDDHVELVVDADGDGETYHRFAVSAAGAIYDARATSDPDIDEAPLRMGLLERFRAGEAAWNGAIEAAVAQDGGGWSVELRVPWSALGREAPEAGETIPVQFARRFAEAGRHVVWQHTGRDRSTGAMPPRFNRGGLIEHYAPRRFGALHLGP